MRIFIVVAKNRPDLFQYFTSSFDGIEDITVILDRRLGPDAPMPVGPGQTYADRRTPRDIYDELQSRGFVIVRLPT